MPDVIAPQRLLNIVFQRLIIAITLRICYYRQNMYARILKEIFLVTAEKVEKSRRWHYFRASPERVCIETPPLAVTRYFNATKLHCSAAFCRN